MMRLPGFWNRKRKPHPFVALDSCRPLHYTPEDIRAAFPNPSAPRWTATSGGPGSQNSAEKARRARAYAQVLANQAPAISGAQGHQRTLQVAIKVACGFDLGEDLAFQILAETYNPACQPPWSPAQLRRKIQEALRVCPKRGWLLESGKSDPASQVLKASEPPTPGDDPTRPCFPPFRLDKEGLWFLQKGKADEDGTEAAAKPVRICGPFQVLAEARDAHACAWGLRLRWQDPDGVTNEETIQKELALGEGAELARILVRRGLWVPPDDARRKKLVAYLAPVRVAGRARSVERVGWHGASFVLPDGAYGDEAGGERAYLALELEHRGAMPWPCGPRSRMARPRFGQVAFISDLEACRRAKKQPVMGRLNGSRRLGGACACILGLWKAPRATSLLDLQGHRCSSSFRM